MPNKRKKHDALPEEFSSFEAATEFWDKHDTTDFPDAFSEVEVNVDLKGRRMEIDIDEDVADLLRKESSRTRTACRPPAKSAVRPIYIQPKLGKT
jgi:hypothetical protein